MTRRVTVPHERIRFEGASTSGSPMRTKSSREGKDAPDRAGPDASQIGDLPSVLGSSVSVTIVNHEARDHLRSCLQAVDRHPYTLGSLEIVVLDNASGDGSIEMLRDEFPDVIVVAEDTRRGFGANQNRAVAAASSDFVFMLNPDALVGPRTIDVLVQSVVDDDRVAAAGCRTVNSDGTSRQGRPIPFPTPYNVYSEAFGLGRLVQKRRPRRDVAGDYWLSGGAMLIDRQAFLDVGGFDETYFMYSEDVDLCRRLRMSGHVLAWVPQVSVEHPLPGEDMDASRRRQYEMAKAELLYMRKYYGRTGQLAYRLGAAIRSAVRIVALWLPGLSRAVNTHGRTSDDVRSLNRARIRALLWPARGSGLEDLANTWNSHRSQHD